MGKDKQGRWRGRCTESDCECSVYMKEDLADKLRCDYCDHVPGVHVLLRKCTRCDQCDEYDVDVEEPDQEGKCSYCDCEADKHEVIKSSAVLKSVKVPSSTGIPATQPRPATAPAIGSTHPPAIGPTHAPAIGPTPPTTIGPAYQTGLASQYGHFCKYPGCQKPCFVEGQKVHEFCGRTHATAYLAMHPGGPGGFGGPGGSSGSGGSSGPGGPVNNIYAFSFKLNMFGL